MAKDNIRASCPWKFNYAWIVIDINDDYFIQ
jgi:hypothetical protein